MYSIVMMAALTTGADVTPAPVVVGAPAYAGCTGCTGYAMDYSYSNVGGCCGYSYGCSGGHHHARRFHGHKHSCMGASSCCGYYAGPYYGTCCGYGSYSYAGCGGCYGSYSFGGGCGYMPPYGAFNIGGGGAYYMGGTHAPMMSSPAIVYPAAPVAAPVLAPTSAETKSSAFLRFTLPAGAKLTVDGRPTGGEGTERSFYTPSLEAGRKFFYEVKAEMVVNGETVVEEKRVVVQAGADLRESFPKLLAAAASAKPEAVATK